ncbi:MAG: anti-sigma regulatory factor [Bacteroidales bacterium]|jgi:anti-sigma regulatory factor (Ser/Thr protein kinase)|nr:anti-sigma regulatory factor [Bacteroidales bacterium]
MVKKEYQIIAKNYDLAGRASSDIKRTLKSMNLCRSLMKRVCSSSYEAEINIVIHSYGGYAIFEINDQEIKLEFHDDGPGIFDIELAMQEGYSTATELDHMNGFGAGMGLSNIKKSADTMDLKSSEFGTDLILTFKITGECYDED